MEAEVGKWRCEIRDCERVCLVGIENIVGGRVDR